MLINKELANAVNGIGLCHLDNLGALPSEMLLTLYFIDEYFFALKTNQTMKSHDVSTSPVDYPRTFSRVRVKNSKLA